MRSLSIVTLTYLALAVGNAQAETKSYTMSGMTCGSCVKSVSAQVCKLPGVEKCEVDINKMTLTGKLDDKAISQAVEKAGFTVASSKAESATTTVTPSAPEASTPAAKTKTPAKAHN